MAKKTTNLPAFLFHEGTNYRSHLYFGAHDAKDKKGKECTVFRVWAPRAQSVSVVGDFCDWDPEKAIELKRLKDDASIWEGFGYDLKEFDIYKYRIVGSNGKVVLKCDPYGTHMETRPATGSKIYHLDGYQWHDEKWMQKRSCWNAYQSPINIYEVHLGSWRKHEDGEYMDYRTIAGDLVKYCKEMGYTHIEVMPLTEYPYEPSWGYQVMAYFSPTSRYGTPKDLMYLVDLCHRNGLGVIMDWVPAHFPKDEPGLSLFDGEPLYEYADPRKGEHYQWGTKVFDYGRKEVVSFLTSSAMYWLDNFHFDGLRVDAVASMLYLNYLREDGQWIANENGGCEHLEAVKFLQQLNIAVFREHPGVLMMAEESSAWPMVTKPVNMGGLGFNFKWNMGWMNDMLKYIEYDPIYRQYHHNNITFSLTYAFSENYVLPLSHDEVVYGKKSLLNKNPGEYEMKFQGLRAFMGYTMGHPGKKLSFMGNEFAQFDEWNFAKQLDWFLLSYNLHGKMQEFTKELNHFYLKHPAFYEKDDSWEGFQWINADDAARNIASFRRIDKSGNEVVCVINFAPVKREKFRLGVRTNALYREALNSDDVRFGGTGCVNPGWINAEKIPCDNQEYSIEFDLAPLSCQFFTLRHKAGKRTDKEPKTLKDALK